MIILDTHIWIWWVHNDPLLSQDFERYIRANVGGGLGVSIFSCWEVAKLDSGRKISLPVPIQEWLDMALADPGIRLIGLTPQIIVEANNLPGQFHRDPADQLIVATARVYGCPLVMRIKG
ncbi:MAG: type II toxin-antitoxin system VapC family toxin [Acidobacteriota bacterium]|nr:type II toxin-antitoxin system VapC family toxin [Acidobacteriota bacterium]